MLRLYLYARVRISLCILHTRPRVQQAPGFPCALYFMRGWKSDASLGHLRPRECGPMPSRRLTITIKKCRYRVDGHRSSASGGFAGRPSFRPGEISCGNEAGRLCFRASDRCRRHQM